MAPDHCEEVLTVPPVEAVPVTVTIFSRAYILALLPAPPLVEAVFVTALKELVGVPSVYLLLTNPIPQSSSLACVVVVVVPVLAVALLPVVLAIASKGLAVKIRYTQ